MTNTERLLTTPCRLCAAAAEAVFTKTLLDRYRVTFFRCTTCESLESECPYWLDEAYKSVLAGSDTGAVYRSLTCHAAIVSIARILHIRGAFLDYGGGAGLLCRLLRDSGFDAYTCDRYADPVYAKAYSANSEQLDSRKLALISAIEVFEHCVEPALEIGRLFDARPHVLFATTVPYHGQGEQWWYIGQQAGQHVFFFSPKAMRMLAERYHYFYFGEGSFHIFSRRSLGLFQRAALRLCLSRIGLRAMGAWIAATRSARFSDSDFQAICGQSLRNSPNTNARTTPR